MENTNTEKKQTTISVLGISEERSNQLVQIVVDTIDELGKTEEIQRANSILACEKALPADLTRTEMLFIGHIVQLKAKDFAYIQAMEKLEKEDPVAALKMLLGNLVSKEKDEEETPDPSAN
jgi:ABC-type Na+ transport system ATPase subunit NatA